MTGGAASMVVEGLQVAEEEGRDMKGQRETARDLRVYVGMTKSLVHRPWHQLSSKLLSWIWRGFDSVLVSNSSSLFYRRAPDQIAVVQEVRHPPLISCQIAKANGSEAPLHRGRMVPSRA